MIFINLTGKMEIINIIITFFLTILRAPKLTWSVTMCEFWSSKKVEILCKRCIGSNFIVGPYQTFRYWVDFAMRYEAVVCDYLPTNQWHQDSFKILLSNTKLFNWFFPGFFLCFTLRYVFISLQWVHCCIILKTNFCPKMFFLAVVYFYIGVMYSCVRGA